MSKPMLYQTLGIGPLAIETHYSPSSATLLYFRKTKSRLESEELYSFPNTNAHLLKCQQLVCYYISEHLLQ